MQKITFEKNNRHIKKLSLGFLNTKTATTSVDYGCIFATVQYNAQNATLIFDMRSNLTEF